MAWLVLAGCQPPSAASSPAQTASSSVAVAARFKGGVITREEFQREALRLPPALRTQFENPAGRREFAQSLVDKRLLVDEAKRRGIGQREDIARQVRELEERLVVQALLADEERTAPAPTETELRSAYSANRQDYAQPERVHVGRVLAAVPEGSSAAERAKARARAEGFVRRFKAGETLARIQSSGDGPERALGGDLGLFARGELKDRRLEDAAFALRDVSQVSPVVETAEGFAVLQLIERREGRIPPFEEVRGEVEGRLAPVRQRKVFDSLRARLRDAADVHIE
ncbi:peptidylprolyl isomerase [Corallococcus sp. M34]|uniref:peptidylprolyl isomerase n=1 Tax=Citreicoccus inhibens TaxID=2849499 RepID=UPI001C22F43E|nr:peptidylprolyl isomerase [Citreicoccus inhibens]MBU8896456.1 peptidylprolyl isomerase [Citreicoccus inhibens]